MSFTVTIKDKKTGEIRVQEEVNAIIAGFARKEKCSTIVETACNGIELCGAITAAKTAIRESLKDNPLVGFMVAALENENVVEALKDAMKERNECDE